MQVHEWITQTKAEDLMVRDVVTFRPDDSFAKAAAVMLEEQISGAPVLDEFGACVGVLSVSDIIGAEDQVAAEREQIANSSYWNSNLALPVNIYQERLTELQHKITPAAERPINRFMTTNLVTVDQQTPLDTVVRDMVDAHVHRVLVVNNGRCLRGIISTIDVFAALLRAGSAVNVT